MDDAGEVVVAEALRSAMRHFAKFAAAVPTRERFLADPLHIEWTMCLYDTKTQYVFSRIFGKSSKNDDLNNLTTLSMPTENSTGL